MLYDVGCEFSLRPGTEYTAYDVKAKKKVKIVDPKVVKMENGRYAVKGKSAASGTTSTGSSRQQRPRLRSRHQYRVPLLTRVGRLALPASIILVARAWKSLPSAADGPVR